MRPLARRRGLLLSSMTFVVLCLLGGFPGGVLSYALGTEVDIAHPDGTDWPRGVGGCSATAFGGPPGGQYSWTAPGSSDLSWTQGTYSVATMTYNSPGRYSVSVEYTWQGQSDSDTEGTFVVLEANVEMDGLSDGNEEDPGGYLGLGGARKRITLSYAIYPGGLAYHVLSLSGSGVEFYASQTGGTPLTDLTWDDCDSPPPTQGKDNWDEIPAELWVEGTSASESLRDKSITLTYTGWADVPDDWYRSGQHTDTIRITVPTVDLDIAGLPEADEERTSRYMVLNDDDDDGDGVVDYDDGYNKDGIPGNDDDTNADEDDLVALTLHQVLPPGITGNVTLSAHSASAKIKVWECSAKGENNLITLPATYNTPADLAKTLYVEGVEASGSEGDVGLKLQYIKDSTTSFDRLKVTVVSLALTAQDLEGEVPEDEEEDPGAYVHFNVDNDNESDNSQGAPKRPGGDYLETGPVADEDDLKGLVIALAPYLQTGEVTLLRSNTFARIWKDPEKGAGNKVVVDANYKEWDLSDAGQRADFNAVKASLQVEGYGSGTTNVTVKYENPTGTEVCSDTVKYTFIAADCGNQPRTEPEPTKYWDGETWKTWDPPGRVQRDTIASGARPNLIHCEWSVTCELPEHDGFRWALKEYNCIAWSVDETDFYYLKGDIEEEWGDGQAPLTVEEMDAFYLDKKGWSPIETGTDEEKAQQAEAIYLSGFHAARRKNCGCGAGRWIMYESKVGQYERIEHVWDQLNGPSYGSPEAFYK